MRETHARRRSACCWQILARIAQLKIANSEAQLAMLHGKLQNDLHNWLRGKNRQKFRELCLAPSMWPESH